MDDYEVYLGYTDELDDEFEKDDSLLRMLVEQYIENEGD